MSKSNHITFDRRRFLSGTTALGAASILGWPEISRAEPPPETRKIRLVRAAAICLAPQFLAEELLRLEGFSEIDYINATTGNLCDALEDGTADVTMEPAPALIYGMSKHPSVVTLAGIHSGCYELFGNTRVDTVRDLKGKIVAVYALGGGDHVLIASMLAYVGIDPTKDVKWMVGEKFTDALRYFEEGKADAFMGFAPQPQEMRAKKIGKVIVNTAQDRPWSQYFCCMLTARRDFVNKYPVATKRAMRAILKASDICSQEPQRVAKFLVTKGYEPRYDIALEVLNELPYRRWREADPEDTLRFHALRLHEVGMIKTSPNRLIAQGTDWRFLNELKKELKA